VRFFSTLQPACLARNILSLSRLSSTSSRCNTKTSVVGVGVVATGEDDYGKTHGPISATQLDLFEFSDLFPI
jgi:hypothetical protein